MVSLSLHTRCISNTHIHALWTEQHTFFTRPHTFVKSTRISGNNAVFAWKKHIFVDAAIASLIQIYHGLPARLSICLSVSGCCRAIWDQTLTFTSAFATAPFAIMPTGTLKQVLINSSQGHVIVPDECQDWAWVYSLPVSQCCKYLPEGTKMQYETTWDSYLEVMVVLWAVSVVEAKAREVEAKARDVEAKACIAAFMEEMWPGLARGTELPRLQ